ncbi:siderophore-interacting protein [Asticcacaulis sp. BYS171W]|uniref:Siderophore-interacting protein n=1 Tax=Asticcacaulis aquaticus TaxID=2984212 RepID=A0ABT5HQD2_9CAUL|nr:siderophore-interacting protein [Asticcacaulis aquaticus]MDC7682025.1 siderophore-interacting protein [Asticcacaulis aquaticus]
MEELQTILRQPTRVRHELKRRSLSVVSVQALTPHMIRVVVGGDDLSGFRSLSHDDHVKVFFPDPLTGEINTPDFSGNGAPVFPLGKTVIARDYTPRAFDAARNELTLDFAVHEAGPATSWAQSAKPGDPLMIGGPKGSTVVPLAFDGYVLIGDDTALPAIARRLEELPAGVAALVIAEIEDGQGELSLETKADLDLRWVHRSAGETLESALETATLPDGDIYVWAACEGSVARRLRPQLIARGVNAKWLKVAAYWQRGSADTHATIED